MFVPDLPRFFLSSKFSYGFIFADERISKISRRQIFVDWQNIREIRKINPRENLSREN